MESRSEHSPPEQQTWNATYITPQPPGRAAQTEAAISQSAAMKSEVCLQVREQLQALLENDGSVRSETATALYVHMAVCSECAREFEAMQRVVHMLEAMPLADLPADYSHLVMRKIQTGSAPVAQAGTVQNVALCDRVRDKLQPLMENDPGVSPELATQLYGHLSVCTECAAEFSTMRSMVNLLETLPPAELPIDYSMQIMRRIQTGEIAAPAAKAQAIVRPTFAASSVVSEGVATHEMRSAAAATLTSRTMSMAQSTETRQRFWQRLIGSVALTGMFVYLLASEWGRQMLGVNMETARVWLSQIGEHLEQVPVLGALIISLGAALAGVNEALGHTFFALGSVAAQTLALELSLGLAACMMLNARRRTSISGL